MNDTLTTAYRDYMEEEGVKFEPRAEEEKALSGSTDFGNVSYIMPATHPQYVSQRSIFLSSKSEHYVVSVLVLTLQFIPLLLQRQHALKRRIIMLFRQHAV